MSEQEPDNGWSDITAQQLGAAILGRRLQDIEFDGQTIVLVFEQSDKRNIHLCIGLIPEPPAQVKAWLISCIKPERYQEAKFEPEVSELWEEQLWLLEGMRDCEHATRQANERRIAELEAEVERLRETIEKVRQLCFMSATGFNVSDISGERK